MQRLKRLLKYAALGLAAVVGLSLVYLAVANAAAQGRLEKKLAALKAAGEPLSPRDLARKPIPPAINAATYLRRAQADVEAMSTAITAARDGAPEALAQAFDRGQPAGTLQQAVRAEFDAHPRAVALLTQAADCPRCDLQLRLDLDDKAAMEALFKQLHDLRSVARVLQARVLLSLAEGKQEQAFATCLAMLRLSRHFDQTPTLVGYLVALAIRDVTVRSTNLVLRAGPLPGSAHEALEAELARHDLVRGFRHAMSTERAVVLDRFQKLAGELGAAYTKLPAYTNQQCDYLDAVEVLADEAALPFCDTDWAKVEEIRKNSGILTSQIVPSLQATRMWLARGQSLVRALRILNALEERQAAGVRKLTELGLDKQAITDPFDGKLLRAKKLPAGLVIYSVGQNHTDDAGQVDEDPDGGTKDVGLGPIQEPPAARGKPAG